MNVKRMLWGLPLALFAAASTGCSLLKVAVATGDPLSKEEMNVRTMTRGFYYDMAGEVARAADSIIGASDRLEVRTAAVRWKIRATRAGVTAAMQSIPDVAMADLWILCRRMNEGFAATPDSLLFGAQSDIARETAARLDRRAARLAGRLLPAERYALMERFVDEFMRDNPVTESDGADNTTLAWLEFLRENGVEPAYAVGSIAEVLADVNDRVSGQTQQLSNSVGWSKDLIEMRLAQDSLRDRIGAQLDSLDRNFRRMVAVAEHLPEISDRVLEELNEQATQLLWTMDVSVDNAFSGFDRQRMELQSYVSREREALVEQLRTTGEDLRRRAGAGGPGAAVCRAGARGAARRPLRAGLLARGRAAAGEAAQTSGGMMRPDVCAAGEEVFRREADAFLASLPAGWQERWRRAVRQAAAGDGRALAEVRRSRNGMPPLPEGVRAVRIAPRMMLYVPAAPSASVTSVVPVSSAAHAASASGPLPLLVYFHGGGWVLGGIGSCARFCAELAAAGHVLVLAADYRLAPEHPFPQGLDDCMRAVETALRRASEWGGSPERVSVGGDSSGGNLALAVALRRRAEGLPPLRSLVLFYPVVTARADGSASWKRYGQGAALDGTLMETFSLAYASGREEFPLVSPAAASDAELAGLPPLLLVAAGRDILRDQGEAFAERLLRLGVAVRREELAGAVHLFVTVPGQERAFRRAVALAREFLAG